MRSWFTHPVTVGIVSALALAMYWSLAQNHQKSELSEQLQDHAVSQTRALEQQVNQAQTALEQAKTPLAQEKIMRNQLRVQRPGEIIIKLETQPEIPMTQSPEADQAAAKPSIPEQWQSVLFDQKELK